jgi:hypothetical protein
VQIKHREESEPGCKRFRRSTSRIASARIAILCQHVHYVPVAVTRQERRQPSEVCRLREEVIDEERTEMPQGLSPLDSAERGQVDDICRRFAEVGQLTDSRINDCVNDAPGPLRDHVLFELLVEKFGRQFEAGETISEIDAGKCFGCPQELITAARRAAQQDAQPTFPSENGLPNWLGRYELKQPESLGQGAFGVVGLYRDTQLERDVAIKLLKLDHSVPRSGQFWQEVRRHAAVTSNSVVQIYEAGQFREGSRQRIWRPAIVMSYASGGTLRQRIDKSGDRKWSIGAVKNVFIPICRATAELHRDDTIHRDLKPANIIYNAHDQPLLADFGLAAAWFAAMPQQAVGSPAYMASEVVEAWTSHAPIKPDRRQDIWSLGVILYELLAGTRPFVADDPKNRNQLLQRIISGNFTPLQTARPDLDDSSGISPIIGRCLADHWPLSRRGLEPALPDCRRLDR